MSNLIPKEVYESASFQEIKSDFIEFLDQQEEFKDYDFSGSRMNVLIDVIAYAIMYNQTFANAQLFESFGRTARRRSSVVQHAQDNGYLPPGVSAAQTTVRLTLSHDLTPSNINIPKGTKFLGVVLGTESYEYVTWDDYSIIRNNSDQYVTNVNLVQGKLMRRQFTWESGTRVIIEDPDIDRNFMRLYVDGAQWQNWTNRSIVGISGSSNVYYVRETVDGFTEIYFGEGTQTTSEQTGALTSNFIGGLKPPTGSNIVIEYVKTRGEEANGSRDITYVDSLDYITVEDLVENPFQDPNYTGSSGAGDPEDIERIRSNSQIMRETQRRAVTDYDYEGLTSARFGSIIQSIKAFTDSEKPGYQFISIKPIDGLNLTTVQREDIEDYLSDFNLAPITPKVVNPNYLFIDHDILVSYKLGSLERSEEWLQSRVLESLDRYYIDDVENFGKTFAKSKATTYIDETHPAIIGSKVEIELVRELSNFYSTPMAGVKFLNPVKDRTVRSGDFEYDNGSESYNIRYVATDRDGDGISKILVGPFKSGEITSVSHYTGNNFERHPEENGRNRYYVVGQADHLRDKFEFNLGVLAKPVSYFKGSFITFRGKPENPNIYSKNDSLITLEPVLRPEYIRISMEPIV